MEVIFNSISKVIAKYSYGICVATVRQISASLRCCRIDPYNYYLLNDAGSVIVLLPYAQRVDSRYNGIAFSGNSKQYVSTWTAEACEKLLTDSQTSDPPTRIVLFRDLKHHKIIDIINRLIELRVFQLQLQYSANAMSTSR